MPKILLVDDDESILDLLTAVLSANDYGIVATLDGEEAREILLSPQEFDMMISDIDMIPINGMELLKTCAGVRPGMPVIMMTGNASLNTATQALKLGAFDYILKPFRVHEFLFTIDKAMEYARSHAEGAQPAQETPEVRYEFGRIVAESPLMKNVCEMIRRAIPIDIPVLVKGEPGTGKKLVAMALHYHGPRKQRGFQHINCAILPEPVLELELFGHSKGAPLTHTDTNRRGLFEEAFGGSVLLQEVSWMPANLQDKVFKALIEREDTPIGGSQHVQIDARILATTNCPLQDLVEKGSFNAKLFSLLDVLTIEVPPVRDRPEDIRPLAYHFVKRIAGEGSEHPLFDPPALEIMESYPWPGNVCEIENAVAFAMSRAQNNRITLKDIPPRIAAMRVEKKARAAAPKADEFKGKSLKAFIHAKQQEYLEKVRSHTTEDIEASRIRDTDSAAKAIQWEEEQPVASEPARKTGDEWKWV